MTYQVPTCYAFADTETGGLDVRINPLLSIAVVFADPTFKEIDGFALKVRPPENTLLEIPVLSSQHPPTESRYKPRTIEYFMNVATGEMIPGPKAPPNAYIISAGAAEVNGFVGTNANGRWDLAVARNWYTNSQSMADISKVYLSWIAKFFQDKPVMIAAHNATFDHKYVKAYLPELYARFWKRPAGSPSPFPYMNGKGSKDDVEDHDWFCTMRAFQIHVKMETGKRAGSKLSDLAEKCGHVNPAAHEALSDARAGLAGMRWLVLNGLGPNFKGAFAS
jgi:oligoribonuclease (3'-5' exoribonuclease)